MARRKSYSRVAKRPAIDTTIRQTTRSGIDAVGLTRNVINQVGLDTLTDRYNRVRANDDMWSVEPSTIARYSRGGESTERGLPAHFTAFIVNQALRYASR